MVHGPKNVRALDGMNVGYVVLQFLLRLQRFDNNSHQTQIRMGNSFEGGVT